jgi:methionyl-tRNA formyltransferase
MTRAVVFAYHDVGVRCLSVLLAQGIDVRHVYTHADDPNENIWFGSVAELAQLHNIPVTVVGSSDQPGLMESIAAAQADFLFSFYYRFMLPPALLALARKGAFNMHGSLLPKYRGRVPVNWAIIHGERETGATLHEMVAKPDAGRLVDQLAVPILPNDTALDVFRKVTVAAETVLYRSLPLLINGTATLSTQNLAAGNYCGGRKPEDGRVNWNWSAAQVHNLIRAVAPPYPGAFCDLNGKRLNLFGTIDLGEKSNVTAQPALLLHDGQLHLRCNDGGLLQVTQAQFDGTSLTSANLQKVFGATLVNLPHKAA